MELRERLTIQSTSRLLPARNRFPLKENGVISEIVYPFGLRGELGIDGNISNPKRPLDAINTVQIEETK